MDFPAYTKTEAAIIETVAHKLRADPYAVAAIVYSGICLGSIERIAPWTVEEAYLSATRSYIGG